MEREIIVEIQEALRTLSFFDPRLMPIAVDGIYSRQTAQAVTIFQTLNDLEPTGEVDTATWEELHDRVRDVRGEPSMMLDVFPHPAYRLRPDEKEDIAWFVQVMLTVLSRYYDNINAVLISGVYDPATVKEIRRIQTMYRIEPTGITDVKTWNVLVTLYNNRLDTAKR